MKKFNIIICGVGGQGIITLLKILAQSALLEGFDIKTSELHGLSQRGGSVKVHVRIGKEISSPLILPGQADFILALELQESLGAEQFANPNTIFLVNENLIPILGSNPKPEKIKNSINKISNQVYFINATSITAKELKNPVVAGVFLLAYAGFKKFIPISYKSIVRSTDQIIKSSHPKYRGINKRAAELAKKV